MRSHGLFAGHHARANHYRQWCNTATLTASTDVICPLTFLSLNSDWLTKCTVSTNFAGVFEAHTKTTDCHHAATVLEVLVGVIPTELSKFKPAFQVGAKCNTTYNTYTHRVSEDLSSSCRSIERHTNVPTARWPLLGSSISLATAPPGCLR